MFCPAELEAASSTTQSETPTKLAVDPSVWSIEDVIQFITTTDPLLGIHADIFRRHVSEQYIFLTLNCGMDWFFYFSYLCLKNFKGRISLSSFLLIILYT